VTHPPHAQQRRARLLRPRGSRRRHRRQGRAARIGQGRVRTVDLKFATCRMALIRPHGEDHPIVRVASKYPRIAARWLTERGSPAEVVTLEGNVELACLTGLADAVVDIVESGSTLRANNLRETDTLFESSARFIVNRASLK